MEIISELPCGFLDELNLDNDRKNVLLEQINRFNRLSEIKISNKDIKLDILGNIIFPAGTIIHGTNDCNPDKIASIAKSGILTGQAVGISEDCETYYCADFHRVPNDITVEEFNSWFPYRDGRCPFGSLGRNSLAFVAQPCEEIEELLRSSVSFAKDPIVKSDTPITSDKSKHNTFFIYFNLPYVCL